MAGVQVYTASGMQVHFRLAFDEHSDVCLLEMLTTREPSSRLASFYKAVNTKRQRQNFCKRVWFSRKLHRLCKVQQLIKFLTFRSVHFHPTPFTRPSFLIFQRVWLQDYSCTLVIWDTTNTYIVNIIIVLIS